MEESLISTPSVSEDLRSRFADLVETQRVNAYTMPGLSLDDTRQRTSTLSDGLQVFDVAINRALKQLPDGRQLVAWEYEALQEVVEIKGNSLDKIIVTIEAGHLTKADFRSCALSDAKFISMFTHIRSLDLSNNPITDISPLAELPCLTTLYIRNVPIIDLDPLFGSRSLKALQIAYNQFSERSEGWIRQLRADDPRRVNVWYDKL